MKSVIVEGCDGSGKTTLIGHLFATGNYVKHDRASTSLGGPVPDLDIWVGRDLDFLHNRSQGIPFIYDRHPLVSELIYADLREKNRGVKGWFLNPQWIIEAQQRMAEHAILVICSPPYSEVERIMQMQGRDAHMPGVFENRLTIFKRYQAYAWPGTIIRYDRTRNDVSDLIETLTRLEK